MCRERIVWRQNEAGSVSCFCQDCDFQGYAKEGTQAKKTILAKFGTPADVPAPAAPSAQAAPEKKQAGAFGAFGL